MHCTIFRQWLVTVLLLTTTPIVVASPGSHPPFEVMGHVIKNHDGDTIKLATQEFGMLNVRFSGADTPETGQAYWKVARDFLKAQVEGNASLLARLGR